jgi:hypothetical protein
MQMQVADVVWERSTPVISGMEEASPESVCAQVSEDANQKESASGLDVGECEKRVREMPAVHRSMKVAT